MQTKIVKGVIQNCNYKTSYDNDGNEYKKYWITIDKEKYTGNIPRDIYLEQGMNILLELKADSPNEVLSGYCIKMGYQWGKNANSLKKHLDRFDEYEFMEGTVIEKRKSNTGSIDMTKSNSSNGGSRISYTIILNDNSFHASRDEGESLKLGMEIALVLKKDEVILILDKKTGKISGLANPYYILFLVLIIVLNGTQYYYTQTYHTNLFKTNSVIIVLNIFLILSAILNIATLRVTNPAKKFLLKKVRIN